MKRFAAIFLLSSTAVATAHAAPLDAAPSDGFYAGVALGYSHNDLDVRSAGSGADDRTLHAADFGVVGGYQMALPNNFFVALEGEILASGGRETGLYGTEAKIQKRATYGAYVKPGYQIDERWATYLTLGAQWAEYRVTNSPAGYRRNEHSAGFAYGLGVNYRLDSDVSLSAEYTRAHPSDNSFTLPGVGVTEIEPEIDNVRLALKYHF